MPNSSRRLLRVLAIIAGSMATFTACASLEVPSIQLTGERDAQEPDVAPDARRPSVGIESRGSADREDEGGGANNAPVQASSSDGDAAVDEDRTAPPQPPAARLHRAVASICAPTPVPPERFQDAVTCTSCSAAPPRENAAWSATCADADGGAFACMTPPGHGPYVPDNDWLMSWVFWTACKTNADCTDHPGGRCGRDGYVVPGSADFGTACFYDQCATDEDCPSGTVCECGTGPDTIASVNRCVRGNCRVDADCGDGQLCAPSPVPCTPYTAGYFCTTRRDDCAPSDGDHTCFFIDDHWEWIGDDCSAL